MKHIYPKEFMAFGTLQGHVLLIEHMMLVWIDKK